MTETMSIKQQSILIVDDEKDIRQSMACFLEDYGYTVLQAEDGLAGLEAWREQQPDLVLLDLRMPNMNGLEVLKELSKIKHNVPAIVISGTGEIRDVVEALHQGAWDYLLKPIEDLSVLHHSVKQAFERIDLMHQASLYQQELEEKVALRTQALEVANQELKQVNRRLREIVQSTRQMSFCLNVHDFCVLLLQQFGHQMGAHGGSIYLREQDGFRLVHSLDPGHSREFIPLPLRPNSVFDYVLKHQKPLLLSNRDQFEGINPSGWSGYKQTATLTFPLFDENKELIGLISLHDKDSATFIEQDKEIGQILCSFCCEALRATRTSQALRMSEELFRMVVTSSKDAMISINSRGRVAVFNPAAQEMFGRTQEEMQGQTLDFLIPEEFRQKHAQYISSYFKTGHPRGAINQTTELVATHKNGHAFPIELSLSEGQCGQEPFVLAVIRDITDRKKNEAQRARLELAIAQAGDALCILDMDWRIEYANHAFEKMTCYPVAESMGMDIGVLFHDDQLLNTMHEAVKAGEPWNSTMACEKKNGSTFQAETTVSPIRDENGHHIINYILSLRDVSREELLEAQLRQSQKLESVGRLAGGIAHDFNNLLSPILGYTELLTLELSPDDRRYHDLLEVQRAAGRARDLTRQLLAFSRKQVLEMKVTNLSTIVEGFTKILRRTIREDIDLKMDLPKDVPNIRADVSQIEQVLMNLAVNAQDAMPHGGCITVQVTFDECPIAPCQMQRQGCPGRCVQLIFSDNGCGMDEETLRHIFEPFFTTKKVGEGSGLGLAMVYGIIKQHDGCVDIQSQPGMGTRFQLNFPVIEEDVESVDPLIDFGLDLCEGQENILVVEDNHEVRKLVCRILKKHGYGILEASNAQEALELIDFSHPRIDLLLSDVVMPNMNGRELYDEVKKRIDPLKVIFMSGYTDNVLTQNGTEDSEFELISKPVSVKALTSKVREVLDR